MFQLHIENQVFSRSSDFEQDFSAFPDMAKTALAFVKAWISGETDFSQQTSGSTGVPKKIELKRRQMQASARATGVFFSTNPSTRLLCCLNPEYIAGKMMLVRAMVWDCPVWLVEPSGDPLEKIQFTPDFVAMAPLQAEKAMNNPQSLEKLKMVRNLILGGIQVSETLKSKLAENGIQAWQTYGMTETVSHIALARIQKSGLIYETLPGVEVGKDQRGALWIKSPMSGPNQIQTNDLVDLHSSHSFRWLGRVDFTVNSGGVKLHPELLEQKTEVVIQTVFPDSQFFFFGEPDEKLGQRLVLIVEGEESKEKSQQLLGALRQLLHPYEVPKNIHFRRSFIRTDSGKVNRLKTFES